MDKKRQRELDSLMRQWANARSEGVFDELGWHGGIMDQAGGSPSSKSPSNRAMVAAMTRLRRGGHTEALLVESALQMAAKDHRRAILALKHRYLTPGTWQQQADALAEVAGSMSKDAYRTFVKAGLHALDQALASIENSTPRIVQRYWRTAG